VVAGGVLLKFDEAEFASVGEENVAVRQNGGR
jgi:hypothetical protein